jgi:hypothetical protein
LTKLADPKASPNWWQDVLGSKDLVLAVRGGYLNAYAQGQSILKIGSERGTGLDTDGNPVMEIHYKYLVEPSRKGQEYVRFNGKSFLVEPRDLICTHYESGRTLDRLIAAASVHADSEKQGVHVIAARNPTVVDLEIAFTQASDAITDAGAFRIDLAALHPDGDGKFKLVFYEAKRAKDVRLRAGSTGPPMVVEQMNRYDEFVRTRASDLVQAYRDVCAAMVKLRSRRPDSLAQIIRHVAAETSTSNLSVDPVTRLLVFGFDQDHSDGKIFMGHIENLQGLLRHRVIAKGSPKSFDLLKDYVRFPVSAPAA